MEGIVTITLIKRDGKLINNGELDKVTSDNYVQTLKEGQRVEVTYEIITESKTNSQLRKVNQCARVLASETGASFEDMKNEIKKKAGFYNEATNTYKSHKIMSKEDLSACIKAALEIGEGLDCRLL